MRAPFAVLLTRAAERDLRQPGAARRFVAALRKHVQSLEELPERGAPLASPVGPYRQLVHGAYRTIYRVEGERVIVLRVVHGARLLEWPGADR